MIPVIKGWCTEVGVELTSLGVQVHGGMGFVEETEHSVPGTSGLRPFTRVPMAYRRRTC